MKSKTIKVMTAAVLCLALPTAVLSDTPQKTMNVRQGPETVFTKPVAEIVPGLSGATASGQNGRVGNEFVFWGFKLADGSKAYLYACAPVEGVDCLERRAKICSASTKVISENKSVGEVQKLSCKVMCVADATSEHPCCSGAQEESELQVGLVSCGN